MAIKCEEYNRVCVVSIDGDLTGDTPAAIRRAAEHRLEQKQVVNFVLDLAKTRFIDSDGLEALLWLKAQSEELFGRVKLAAADDVCRKILEITRLAHRFECHADLPAALKSMR